MKTRLSLFTTCVVLIILAIGLTKAWPKDTQKVIFESGLLNVQVKEISIKSLINEISKRSNIQVSIGPELEDKIITVDFKNKSMENGLKAILQSAGISNKAVVYKKTSEEGKPDQWVIEKIFLLEKGTLGKPQEIPPALSDFDALRKAAIDTSWRNYKNEKVYKKTKYGFELRYPETLSPEESYDSVYDRYCKRIIDERLRVAFFSPQDIARSKLHFDTAFMLIFAQKIDPKVGLEDWIQKRLLLPDFKEFKLTKEDMKPGSPSNPWGTRIALGDFLGKIAIGKEKKYNGYLFHQQLQAKKESTIYLKHKDNLIEIVNIGGEHTSFLEDPIVQRILETFKFIEARQGKENDKK
jgi:hypothetical protein